MNTWYPTVPQIATLGFLLEFDEHGAPGFYIDKGNGRKVELVYDEGSAVLVEWLPDGIHAWTTCDCYELLEHACTTAFNVIAEGR